jgi:hypothetical protein
MTEWYIWGIPVILASLVLLYLLVAVIPRYFRKGVRIFPDRTPHFLSGLEDLYEGNPNLRANAWRTNEAIYRKYRKEEEQMEEEEER